ncbi:DUF4179 domain-containing protein [Paenibacillus dokdonensis]|uniref:DUF4179 domain-containing protein n=1 Tax=Paenibacillus dokdonensis TaxID=2567944 RepID=A0ABU6GS08_9BACL|nr:DUF4179 domain-containing protein [Paenibacillus dokdonensis]MEC0240937.1 DUF4179 domain-containing protein [Paenibacillus dokdonensis]
MVEDQEKLLEQYYQPAAIAAHRVAEQQLDAALRNGLMRGKKTRSQKRKNRVVISFAAAVLLFIGAAIYVPDLYSGSRFGVEPASTSSNIQVPAYVEKFAGDKGMLREALDQGKYQAVGATAAYEGYQVTVDGILTDRRHLVLFFTSHSDTGETIVPYNPGIYTLGYDKLEFKQFSHGPKPISGLMDTSGYHDMLVFDLIGSEKLPEEFYFSSKWDNGEPAAKQKFLEVKIPVDLRKMAVLERTIKVNKTLDFEGQKMNFTEVVQMPLRLNVHLVPDSANTKEFEFALNYHLYTKNQFGETELIVEEADDNPAEWIYGYYSPEYVQGDALILQGDGIQTIAKKDMKLVIDTNQRKVMGGSDSRLKLQGVEKEDFSMFLQLAVKSDLKSAEADTVQHVGVAAIFTDGQGDKHTLPRQDKWINEIGSDHSVTGMDEYMFEIENMSYPQPLKFDVTQYLMRYIKKPFTVTIQ